MPFGVTWSSRMSICWRTGRCGGRVETSCGKFEYRVDLFPRYVELLDDFALCWLRLRGFRTRRTRASGYRETPMRRPVCPARFPRRGIGTNQELPCCFRPLAADFTTEQQRFTPRAGWRERGRSAGGSVGRRGARGAGAARGEVGVTPGARDRNRQTSSRTLAPCSVLTQDRQVGRFGGFQGLPRVGRQGDGYQKLIAVIVAVGGYRL